MIIDGKVISAAYKENLKKEIDDFKKTGGKIGLAVIIVGDDKASKIYVGNKRKSCEELGIFSEVYELPENTAEEKLLSLIDELNRRDDISGILCQLPLPKGLNEETVINAIRRDKDVDAFSPYNVGKIMQGKYEFLPCTPAGIMEMLRYEKVDIVGKNCVVIGRSNIVGKPMAMLLLNASGTVTVCHSKTVNLPEITKNADILVVAVGKAKFVTADMVKPGAVVIDVGMNRDENGKLCGDVDFENVEPIASKITPVPGGVGLMTVTMLMRNTLTAAKNLQNK